MLYTHSLMSFLSRSFNRKSKENFPDSELIPSPREYLKNSFPIHKKDSAAPPCLTPDIPPLYSASPKAVFLKR